MATSKKVATKTAVKATPAQAQLPIETPKVKQLELYVIEEGIELPIRGAGMKHPMWEKLEKIMAQLEAPKNNRYQSFVVAQVDGYKVAQLAKEKFPEWKFKISTIVGNPSHKRIFRLA